ncbi:MAG: T9SS type A sorting domain-containing protein [Bacteroidetes bacterium]|nr:T9SS type A sorting domain-containing protein [Bacteroidota bacterium]
MRLFLHPREGGADNTAITVYPNPANEQLNIQVPASHFNKSFNLIITDLSGRIVYSENSNSGESGLINIHLQNSISSGTYIIQLVGDNYTSTTSVVIE